MRATAEEEGLGLNLEREEGLEWGEQTQSAVWGLSEGPAGGEE